MPLAEARLQIQAASGVLLCKRTIDWRIRECTGRVSSASAGIAFDLLIASVHDSAAVIVLSARNAERVAPHWVAALRETFGTPDHQPQPHDQVKWQWIRAGKMLRVVERKSGGRWETTVTLTHGPLLDGLGPTQRKRPDPKVRP
jgi:hypothetical protein